MENLTLTGEITATLEDKNGNIIKTVKQKNNITDAYLRYILYDAVNHGTLSNLLNSNIRTNYNFLSRSVPSEFGIYALSKEINITPNSYSPPYVHPNGNALSDNVVFYNIAGDTVETDKVMVPAQARCYVDTANKEVVFEYQKNTRAGTVKSVCVGKSHAVKETAYLVSVRDIELPSTFYDVSTTNYILEHSEDSTTIYKSDSASKQQSFNVKTKEFQTYAVSAMHTNIGKFGSIALGDTLYKVLKKSASGNTHIVTLTYTPNWKTATTNLTLDITFTARTDLTVNTTSTPVLVARPDNNTLEIFVTVSTGLHTGTGYGCNIQKAVVDLEDMSTEVIDLGIFSYGVGNWSSPTTNLLYSTGLYHEGNYYLPVFFYQTDETLHTLATATYQDGIITSNFTEIKDLYSVRLTASGLSVPVITDKGVLQMRVTEQQIPYAYMSQVISGANFPEPIEKDADHMLRISYRYKFT